MRKKIWKIRFYVIAKEFFQYSLITYILLFIAESLQPGIVSYFFDPTLLLGVVLLSGVIMVVTYNEKVEVLFPPKERKKRDILVSIVLAIGGALLVFYKTQDLGIVSIIISAISAGIIILLALLILQNPE